MLAATSTVVSQIHADELTEGDIIRHFTGELWQVYSEPKYTERGIIFEVLCLDLDVVETQTVTFAPDWRFDFVGYQNCAAELEAA